jgi:hypothetical protein
VFKRYFVYIFGFILFIYNINRMKYLDRKEV